MKILLDTDAGVDDALALLLLLRCPDIAQCVGITVVAGNTPLPQAVSNTLRVLEVARLYTDGRTAPAPPVSVGAEKPLKGRLVHATEVHGEDGLGGVSLFVDQCNRPLYPEASIPLDARPAYRFILDTANTHPGEVTLVAIAPLTNLALAAQGQGSREAAEAFRPRVAAFEDRLAEWKAGGKAQAALAVALRVAFDELERQAELHAEVRRVVADLRVAHRLRLLEKMVANRADASGRQLQHVHVLIILAHVLSTEGDELLARHPRGLGKLLRLCRRQMAHPYLKRRYLGRLPPSRHERELVTEYGILAQLVERYEGKARVDSRP